MGGWFKLNPKVDDIPENLSITHRGVRLLRLGTVRTGGAGCLCPENALLKALVTHLLLRKDQTLILDMEAGIEHLGRGTAGSVDAFVIVVEPGLRSLGTAEQIRFLASEIGVPRIFLVANKVRRPAGRGVRAQPRGRRAVCWARCRSRPRRSRRTRAGSPCSTARRRWSLRQNGSLPRWSQPPTPEPLDRRHAGLVIG